MNLYPNNIHGILYRLKFTLSFKGILIITVLLSGHIKFSEDLTMRPGFHSKCLSATTHALFLHFGFGA